MPKDWFSIGFLDELVPQEGGRSSRWLDVLEGNEKGCKVKQIITEVYPRKTWFAEGEDLPG
jgi:hypothetical protein